VTIRVSLVLVAVPMLLGGVGDTRADCPPTPGQQVVDLVNAERVARGLAPYGVSFRLHEAASAHARDLASGPDAGHRGSDGSDPSGRADRVGYRWVWIGENVAAGQRTPGEVDDEWMGSEPHRHNILDVRFTQVAVGFEPEAASRWGTYWVMMFGSTEDPDAYTGQACNP